MKPKALYFYQYLPPWRIDVFNEMAKYYELTIVFFNAECEGFTYNRQDLLAKLHNIETIFLNNGFSFGNRPIRFGIFSLLKKYKPDVVFVHEYSFISIMLALYKRLNLIKYNLYITTSDNVKMAEFSTGFKAKSRDYVLKQANGAIVYSKKVKDWYKKHYPTLKLEICPNIQNPESLLSYTNMFPNIIDEYKHKYNLKDTPILLYTGRLVDVKGIDLLLSAFAKSNYSNYKLVIVGDGRNKEELQQQAKSLNMQDRVIFAGFYSGISLYAWYALADFFVLPSRYEPFGAVINEALVYGCPVVASKYIGALDFINETNGIIFDPLNETEFVNVLNKAMEKYKNPPKNKKNLMTYPFQNAVNSFYQINL